MSRTRRRGYDSARNKNVSDRRDGQGKGWGFGLSGRRPYNGWAPGNQMKHSTNRAERRREKHTRGTEYLGLPVRYELRIYATRIEMLNCLSLFDLPHQLIRRPTINP